VIQPLGPAPGRPQVLLVLAPDEAAHIDTEAQIGAAAEAQGPEGDAEFGAPAAYVARGDHVPDAVPVFVQVVDADELRVPQRAIGLGAEHERPAAIVKAVD